MVGSTPGKQGARTESKLKVRLMLTHILLVRCSHRNTFGIFSANDTNNIGCYKKSFSLQPFQEYKLSLKHNTIFFSKSTKTCRGINAAFLKYEGRYERAKL